MGAIMETRAVKQPAPILTFPGLRVGAQVHIIVMV